MDREALEFIFEHEDLTDLDTLRLLLSLRSRSSALPSAAPRRLRTTTRIRSRRSSRLSRPQPPPTSAPVRASVGLLSPGLQGLIDIAAMDVNQDQPPEARRSQEQEPEFVITTTPTIDHIGVGVPSSAGGIDPPTHPPTPVRRETARTSARTRSRVVKFRSAYWVWIVLSRLPVDPLPPYYNFNPRE